jgi:predicted hotdog family 3-hydroxylacyl-ACP dehydratase
MVLLDGIVSFDETGRELVAAATIREGWNGNWVAVELMAQASAALAGIFDRIASPGRPARPGFLLGTRRLSLDVPAFEVGRRYLVRSRNEFSDGESASFDCAVLDGERPVAHAILSAYCPADAAAFLAARRTEGG